MDDNPFDDTKVENNDKPDKKSKKNQKKKKKKKKTEDEGVEDEFEVESDATKDFIAGGVGGICNVVGAHPMDTVKVRLQTTYNPKFGKPPEFKGTYDVILQTLQKEGYTGLYKGMSTPLSVAMPMYASYFLIYGFAKRIQKTEHGKELSNWQYFKAGMAVGLVCTVIVAPGERIKCLLQVQQEDHKDRKYKGPIDCAVKIFRQEGIRGLYRGTGATLLRDVHSSGVYFMTYEYFKRLSIFHTRGTNELSISGTLIAGGLAGACSWFVAIPPDVLKSRYQTAPEGTYPRGMRDVARKIYLTEGFRSLYKGFTPIMLKAFSGNGLCFLGYELTLRLLNWLAPDL